MLSLKLLNTIFIVLTSFILFVSSTVAPPEQYSPPATATVVPFSPKGLRLTIPHVRGIVWVEYHVRINQEFNGLENDPKVGIVKPTNGQWVYEDQKSELNYGDIVHYWVYIIHNNTDYTIADQEYPVIELYNRDKEPIIQTGAADFPQKSSSGQFVPPNGTVYAFDPEGLRISIPHVPGIVWVSFHMKINEPFEYGLEVGSITVDTIKPIGGQWIYEDKSVKLKVGDVVYYWVNMVHNQVSYNLVNQQYNVSELYAYDKAPQIQSGLADIPQTSDASRQFEPQNATAYALYPKGLRISIPHVPGIVWTSFHLKINENFRGTEAAKTIYIVKPHDGKWTIEDKSLELKVGDVVNYWINIVHNQVSFNLLNQQLQVTELLSEDKLQPIPGSGRADVAHSSITQEFIPPNGTAYAFAPKGLQISIPHVPGMTWVSFHVKFNDEFKGLEVGPLTKDIIKPHNRRWTYHDKTTKLKVGDVVYYWIHIIYNDLPYNLLDQQYRVIELIDRSNFTQDSSNNVSNGEKLNVHPTA